jgi:hypothetical protein
MIVDPSGERRIARGQAFLDACGRHWEVQAALRDDEGNIDTVRVRMAFREAHLPPALFVMSPVEFFDLVQRAALKPVYARKP